MISLLLYVSMSSYFFKKEILPKSESCLKKGLETYGPGASSTAQKTGEQNEFVPPKLLHKEIGPTFRSFYPDMSEYPETEVTQPLFVGLFTLCHLYMGECGRNPTPNHDMRS